MKTDTIKQIAYYQDEFFNVVKIDINIKDQKMIQLVQKGLSPNA